MELDHLTFQVYALCCKVWYWFISGCNTVPQLHELVKATLIYLFNDCANTDGKINDVTQGLYIGPWKPGGGWGCYGGSQIPKLFTPPIPNFFAPKILNPYFLPLKSHKSGGGIQTLETLVSLIQQTSISIYNFYY